MADRSLSKMLKDELLAYAAEHRIPVDSNGKKKDLYEQIRDYRKARKEVENAGGAGGKKAKKPAASGKSKRASEDDDDEIVVGEAGEEVVGENKPKAVKTPPQKKAKTAAPAAFAEDKAEDLNIELPDKFVHSAGLSAEAQCVVINLWQLVHGPKRTWSTTNGVPLKDLKAACEASRLTKRGMFKDVKFGNGMVLCEGWERCHEELIDEGVMLEGTGRAKNNHPTTTYKLSPLGRILGASWVEDLEEYREEDGGTGGDFIEEDDEETDADDYYGEYRPAGDRPYAPWDY